MVSMREISVWKTSCWTDLINSATYIGQLIKIGVLLVIASVSNACTDWLPRVGAFWMSNYLVEVHCFTGSDVSSGVYGAGRNNYIKSPMVRWLFMHRVYPWRRCDQGYRQVHEVTMTTGVALWQKRVQWNRSRWKTRHFYDCSQMQATCVIIVYMQIACCHHASCIL